MRSKTFIKPDGAAEMQQISIEICGKGGATGIKAVTVTRFSISNTQ